MTAARQAVGAWLAGYIPDLPTPFDAGGQIDWTALAALCRRQIAADAPAVVVADMAGEASTLTLAEHRELVGAVTAQARGHLAVVAGVSSNSTAHAIELARQAEAAGADALIAVVPYYNKPMQSGIYHHFRAIADATSLPIILQDVPSRTVRGIADETVAQLAASAQFVGLKDGSCDLGRPLRLKRLLRPDFRLLSGDDVTAFGYLAQGGDGCISLAANVVPALCRRLYLGSRQRSAATVLSADTLVQFAALSAALAEDGAPAALKYALSLDGAMSAVVRLPLVELPEASRATIRQLREALDRATLHAESGVVTAAHRRR